ncbi:MAG: hypothetical protein DRH15_04190 [Deltaproteobacteria bacterium]|nr:MAG: hypothetical protein DRH15_04190 [Deltaproteobacteria bacterium]
MEGETFTYYEWENTAELWLKNEEQFDQDYPSTYYSSGLSVAEWIVTDVFGLDLSQDSRGLGGDLPGYDINSADALQTIKLSLAQELANRRLIEIYADEYGRVKFYPIGESTSSIFGSDILYKIENSVSRPTCDLVVVDGYDPPPKRYIKENERFDLFRFLSLYPQTDDPDFDVYPRYYVLSEIFDAPGAITQCAYQKEGFIEYGKFNLNDVEVQTVAGIIDRKHWEQVISFIHEIDPPTGFDPASTIISFNTTTPRYIELDDFGQLQPRVEISQNVYNTAFCLSLQQEEVDTDKGVILPESDNKKFLGVKAVFIYGYKLNYLKLYEYKESADGAIKVTPNLFEADLDTFFCEPFALTAGQDYQVVKESYSDFHRIIFSCNVLEKYADRFGGTIDTAPQAKFKISFNSLVDQDGQKLVATGDPLMHQDASGYLRDRINEADTTTTYDEVLFPIGDGQAAYVVKKLIVVYDWDNPCVHIKDDRNIVDYEFLESMEVHFRPIIRKDEPAPTAVNGALIDKTVVEDVDPTTFQDMSTVEMVSLQQSLEGGDVHLSFPFADPNDCETISDFVKTMIDEDGSVVKSITYTCHPDSEPVLGEVLEGAVINSIDYSYQDSSQYVITVTTGPRWQGSSSTATSVYNVKTETVQAEGTVILVESDNVTCYVDVLRFGIMQCINLTKNIIQVGDRVQVSIYNNPVSYR